MPVSTKKRYKSRNLVLGYCSRRGYRRGGSPRGSLIGNGGALSKIGGSGARVGASGDVTTEGSEGSEDEVGFGNKLLGKELEEELIFEETESYPICVPSKTTSLLQWIFFVCRSNSL